MIEGGMLAEREHRVLKVDADNRSRLICKFFAHRRRDDGTGKNEALKRPQTDPISEANKVKVAKNIAITLVDAIAEAVGEKWITGKTLGFLHEKTKCQRRRCVEGGWCSGARQTSLGVNNETTNKMEICVQAMLF